jgi:hypothetical protein
MAPKKEKGDAAPVAEIAAPLPSLDSDLYVDELLAKAKKRDVAALEAAVAAAVGTTDDFKLNLRNGVVVDYVVEAVLFAASLGFTARKTVVFVKWLNQMRESIEATGGVEDAKEKFKAHMVQHAERGSTGPAGGRESVVEDAEAAAASAAAAVKAPAGKKGADAKGKAAVAEVAAPRPDVNIFMSLADMGHVADFVVKGVLQHWQLYHHAAAAPPMPVDTTRMTAMVQVPMRAPPLGRALTADQHEEQLASRRQQAEAELERLQADEDERVAAEAAEAAEQAEAARLLREEHEANTLYFAKHGTEPVVAGVSDEVKEQGLARQQALVARLGKLEELLQLSSPAQPSS